MSGPGLAQLYIMANVHNWDMFSFRILTPENLLEAGGQYRLQARSKVTGNIIYAAKFLILPKTHEGLQASTGNGRLQSSAYYQCLL